jgi:hypothetical protein
MVMEAAGIQCTTAEATNYRHSPCCAPRWRTSAVNSCWFARPFRHALLLIENLLQCYWLTEPLGAPADDQTFDWAAHQLPQVQAAVSSREGTGCAGAGGAGAEGRSQRRKVAYTTGWAVAGHSSGGLAAPGSRLTALGWLGPAWHLDHEAQDSCQACWRPAEHCQLFQQETQAGGPGGRARGQGSPACSPQPRRKRRPGSSACSS